MCRYRCDRNPAPGCPADNIEPAREPVDVPFEDVSAASGDALDRLGAALYDIPRRDPAEAYQPPAEAGLYCPASMMGRGCEQAKGHSGRCVFTRTLRDPDFLWRAPS